MAGKRKAAPVPVNRKKGGEPGAGQFTFGVIRSETDVKLHAPADPSISVTVPNPDDPFDLPIFDGPASDAAKLLVPGTYTAYGVDDPDVAYLLTVPDPGSIVWTENVDGTKDATVEGVEVTVGMLDGEADPNDHMAPRVVVFAAGSPADSGTFAYDFDLNDGGWKATGPGTNSVADSPDQAVRALVMGFKRSR